MFKKFIIDISDKKKSVIMTAIVAFFTFLICLNIIRSHLVKKDAIEQEIKNLSEKIFLRLDIEKLGKIQHEYAKYFYDNVGQEALRSIILGLAKESGVNIVSIRPLSIEQTGLLFKEPLDIALRCTYNQLGLFIMKIESLKNITKLESLSVEGISDIRSQSALSERAQKEFMESDTQLSVSMIVAGYSTKG